MQLTLDELKTLFGGNGYLDHRKKNLVGIKCPKCQEEEFGISVEKYHRFGCYRKKNCGFNGNIFTLLSFLGKVIHDVKPSFAPRTLLEDKLIIGDERKIDLELPDHTMPVGWRRVMDNEYLNSRGFTKRDYEKFEVGVTKIDPRFNKGWVIFTIKQFGALKGHIARNPKSKKEIELLNAKYKRQGKSFRELRYQNSETDFSKILLGVEEITEHTHTAIIVEGLFDKVNVDRALGLDFQEEVKCVATFKCGASDEQIYLLQESGIDTAILLYDPDVIGEIKKAAWRLDEYFNVYIGFNETGNDPGDMTQKEFDEVFNNLKTPSQFTASKVHVPLLIKK